MASFFFRGLELGFVKVVKKKTLINNFGLFFYNCNSALGVS